MERSEQFGFFRHRLDRSTIQEGRKLFDEDRLRGGKAKVGQFVPVNSVRNLSYGLILKGFPFSSILWRPFLAS